MKHQPRPENQRPIHEVQELPYERSEIDKIERQFAAISSLFFILFCLFVTFIFFFFCRLRRSLSFILPMSHVVFLFAHKFNAKRFSTAAQNALNGLGHVNSVVYAQRKLSTAFDRIELIVIVWKKPQRDCLVGRRINLSKQSAHNKTISINLFIVDMPTFVAENFSH